MKNWKVTETTRESYKVPEAQFNRIVVTHGSKNYEVQGTPFCFAGYDEKGVLRRAHTIIDAFLSEQKKK